MYIHLGGFESTQIFGTGEDILGTTRHIEYWREDLRLLQNAGITELRYSVPWHRIEAQPGEFDWTWFDGPMRWMEKNGMRPILDPLHHTSFPAWLSNGFLNAEFPSRYARFLGCIAERYPWATRYTVFNEPLATTLFCSYTGMWYPHRASDRDFVAMAIQVARAMCLGCARLKEINPACEIVHVGTAEHHRALDRQSEAWVTYANARRFFLLDLVCGRIDSGHALYAYFVEHGGTNDDLRWFASHPVPFDILGLDYYIHSEMEWAWSQNRRRPDLQPRTHRSRGFASIAEDYLERYGLPILLSETNIRGSTEERLSWLKLMEEQCEELVLAGRDFRGFCWYPSLDSTDWANACTRCTRIVDPQGIWTLDASRTARHSSELSETYGRLARQEITSREIPAYRFGNELSRRLESHAPFMRHWNWIDSERDQPA